MNSREDIRQLLNSFYEGKTTLKEEQLLADYLLTTSNLPDEFLEDRELFSLLYYHDESEIELSESFEESFKEWVDTELVDKPRYDIKSTFRKSLLIAATMALLIGLGYWMSNQFSSPNEYDTYSDEIALYEQTKEVLLFVSTELNKGVETVKELEENRNEIQIIINEIIRK